jgi:hypothetical protein
LWLDDMRPAPDNSWVQAWVPSDVIQEYVMHNRVFPIEMSLDHDLGCERTGYDLLRYLIREGIPKTTIVHFHSANPIGRQRMENLWNDYKEGKL